jgi:acyl dehydratase
MTAVRAGDEIPGRDFPISRLDLVRYAGASGDFNPIHWNERFAKSVGLPDVIAHGMYTMAVAAQVITDWAGDPAGARLAVSGKVAAVREDGLVDVELTATVDGQTVLAKARAVVRPPRSD